MVGRKSQVRRGGWFRTGRRGLDRIRKSDRAFSFTRGQGIVEFALVIPILLVLMFGVIEGGHLLVVYSSVVAASREGARYGEGVGMNAAIPYYQDCDGIREAVRRIGALAGIQDSNILISYDRGPGSTTYSDHCTGHTSSIQLSEGDRIKVQVGVPYTPIAPLIPFPIFRCTNPGATPPDCITSASARTIVQHAEMVVQHPPVVLPPCELKVNGDTDGYVNVTGSVYKELGVEDWKTFVYIYNNEGSDVQLIDLKIDWIEVHGGTKIDSVQFGAWTKSIASPSLSYFTYAGGGIYRGSYQVLKVKFTKVLTSVPVVTAHFATISSHCSP